MYALVLSSGRDTGYSRPRLRRRLSPIEPTTETTSSEAMLVLRRIWTRGKERGIHSQITWEGYILETSRLFKFYWRRSILDEILPRYPSGSRIPVSNMCCRWTFVEEITSSCWPLVWAHSFGSTVLIHSLNHSNAYRARYLHAGENLPIDKEATSPWAIGNQRTWQNEAVYSTPSSAW